MTHRIIFFLLTLMLLPIGSFAQEEVENKDSIEVTFAVVIPKEKSLDAGQRIEIKNKLEAVLARLQCAGAIEKTPFVIVPELDITSTSVTAGAKEAFVFIEGNLVLVAKNRYDGTAYNELTIPLKKLVNGKNVKDYKSELIQEINPKDRRFVRFIRNTQQRIVKQYSEGFMEIP